jgi:dTDP-4-dehydrorhamnose reductase/SAM-dependent methyltransferase
MSYSIFNDSLITGGSGMIGNNINFGYKPSSRELDVTNTLSINKYIENKTISCIIHLAALNLRDSENNVAKSIDLNINGTSKMLQAAKKLNVPFILLSTGAVFSSDNPNMKFSESFDTCPNCIYGHTKRAAEEIALLYDKTILIRTGWLFGGNQKTHYKFVENVINNLITQTEVKASNDFFGSPTYVIDFIEQMKILILNNNYGIHHVVNGGNANGYDIAREIANTLNLNNNLIFSVSSEKIPNSGPKRSATEILEVSKSFNALRPWRESLQEYALLYYKNIIRPSAFSENDLSNCLHTRSEVKWKNRDKCRLCNSCNINIFFKLEPTPPANHFVLNGLEQEVIPLDICICDDCKHIQLVQIVDPVFQYSNYFYVSSTSSTMTNHLKSSVDSFVNELNILKTDCILEIGANDGVCVKHLLANGFVNIIGIDPASNINKRHNLPIICDFFGSNVLNHFQEKYTPFKLIYSFHCCAHIENIQDVFETIYKLLDENGTFVMEVGYFYKVFINNCFDTIYHEHIDYHTCTAIQKFASQNNLLLYKVQENNIQGGSIQFLFSKNKQFLIDDSVFKTIEKEKQISLHNYENLNVWKNKILLCGNDINHILNSFISFGKKIAGYGASAKSTTFLYQYKLSNKIIEYIIDDSVYKKDFLSPGLHIPIKSIDHLEICKVDYILILSWNFTNEIIKKLEKYRKTGLRIIVPFPEIKIL